MFDISLGLSCISFARCLGDIDETEETGKDGQAYYTKLVVKARLMVVL